MADSDATLRTAANGAGRHSEGDRPHIDSSKLKLLSEMSQYKSNTFKLELDEMLSQVRLNQAKHFAAAEKVLHRLRTAVDNIRDRAGLTLEYAERDMKKRNIHIPFPNPEPTSDVKYSFSYLKPTYMNVVGSYATKTMSKNTGQLTLDLVIGMPEDIFNEKDYLNYRYFHKRAYYLAAIMDGIKGDKTTQSLELAYELLNDDHLKPIIVVYPSKDNTDNDFRASHCNIRIMLAAPRNVFPVRKLQPAKCSLRNLQGLRNGNNPCSTQATSFYNSSLASDTTYFPYLKYLHSASETCDAFTKACIIARVWLRQRGFSGRIGEGGFGPFEWSILMAFLLKSGGAKGNPYLSQGYSEYQMFKATLQFLANRDLINKPLIVNTSTDIASAGIPMAYDAEYAVNVLFKMSIWSYEMLRHESKMTVDMLSRTSGPDQFDSIFLNRIDYPCVRFDAVASLPMPGMVELDPGFRNGDQHPRMRYLQKLYATLKTGLGDRVKLIHITCPLKSTMSPSGTPENLERHINVGLLFNETNINRKTDRGPAPTDKRQAAAFRQFWGDIAELRRYPDGTITESVSWNSKASRTPIYQQIIRYAVERHFGSGRGETICFAEKPILPLLDQVEDGLSLFTLIQSEYETLEKDLQSLTGIPLALRHTAGTGAALRSAALNIPVDTRRYADPVDVIVQFESSGRWPDNIQAVQKIKISFLARLSSLLEQTKGGELACRLGLENQEHDMMNGTFLDVTYASGTTFRLRILHDREPALLENFISKPAASHREKQRARQALRVHRITFEMLPRHTQLIRKLCQRYPSMSPTIRLVKKWFHSHLLSSHVSDELVELFVARVYLNPYPWSSPCSASTALFRTIDFLARWDWRCDPLIIDLGDNSMTKADIQQCADVFREVRNKDPTMNNCAMFVATNYDLTDSLWTQSMPTKVIAGRITALAKTATQVLKDHPLNVNIYDLFVPSMQEYDFVIHMNKKYTIAGHAESKPKYKNLDIDITGRGEKIQEDPIRDFVAEIMELYDGIALFFWDRYLESHIGGVWSPHAATRNWKATITYSTVPIKGKEGITAQFNKEATLNEISRIGGELISRIDVK